MLRTRTIQISLLASLTFACAQSAPTRYAATPGTGDAQPASTDTTNPSTDDSASAQSPSGTTTSTSVTTTTPEAASPSATSPSPAASPTAAVVVSADGDGRTDTAWKTVVKLAGVGAKWTGTFSIAPSESTVYPKSNLRDQKSERTVQVYIPAGLDKTKEYPFMIVMDDWWQDTALTAISQLITAKKIPMMILVNVQNGGGDSTGSQRGLEYDVLGPANASFFVKDIIPKVEAKYGVKFTKDPEGGGVIGGSSSGAAAFTAAWFMPERFRKVLAYSATFISQGPSTEYPKGALEYSTHLIKEADVKPIRVSLEAGTNDLNNFMNGNINTYNAMVAKGGYHVRLYIAQGAGHVDGGAMSATIDDNLIWLWRDYPK